MKSSSAYLASAILALFLGMLASANDLVFYDADSDCYTSAKNTVSSKHHRYNPNKSCSSYICEPPVLTNLILIT